MESCLALCRHTQPYHRLYALGLKLSPLLSREIRTMPVISLILALRFCLLLPERFKPLWRAIAIICLSLSDKLFGIFLIEIESFRLDIRAIRAAYDRTFIPLYPKPGKSILQIFKGLIAIALSVRIFDTEDELAPGGSGEEIIEQRGAYSTDMLQPCWRRGIANANFHLLLLRLTLNLIIFESN